MLRALGPAGMLAWLPVLLAGVPGCKAKTPQKSASPAAAASGSSPAAAPVPADRCREVANGPSLGVGERGRDTAAGEGEDQDEEDEATLPFAASVGAATMLPGWFAAGGLTPRAGQPEAFVALVPTSGAPGSSIGLGRVHGDVDPPLVAGRERVLVVAVADSDAGGGMLRLARVDLESKKPTSGAELTAVDHDAGAALAVGEERALVVFASKRAVAKGLRAVAFDPTHPETLPEPVDLDGTQGAEAPALVARPGGFFLAWVSERAQPDAGARTDAGTDEGLVASGPRVLMAMPLDARGKPSGPARAVSGESSHVVGFDAVVLSDGALGLAYRQDSAAPGVETGSLELARLGLDGVAKLGHLEDEDLSAGLPALLRDPAEKGRIWVAVRSASDAARVGLLAPSGLAIESLAGDRLLRGAEVLAAGDGKLLVSRGRGRALEMSVVECKP